MKNTSPFVKAFRYHAPIEKVWQALTDPDKMRSWYFPQLTGFEPVAGFRLRFGDAGADYRKEWVVTEVVEGKTLAHSWAYVGYEGSSGVRFDLSPQGGDTLLTVTHTGIDSFPDDPHFKRERFEGGWENLLGNKLKTLLEQ